VLIALVAVHWWRCTKSDPTPDGIEIKKKKDPVTHLPLDGIPFHPYYT